MPQQSLTFPAQVLQSYRDSFHASVQDGSLMPLTIPYTLTGVFIAPILWLTIPHTTRPWLYHTRWPLMLLVSLFSWHILTVTSSGNMAISYAAGLTGSWCIIMNMNLLIWRRVQWDAKRVMRRRRRNKNTIKQEKHQPADTTTTSNGQPAAHVVRRKHVDNGNANLPQRSGEMGHAEAEDAGLDECQYEFYWQAFPADAPFWDRLVWVIDLAISFRGAGWNFAISSIPRPPPPSPDPADDTVDISSLPACSSDGYTVPSSRADLFQSRLVNTAITYIILDFLSVFMMKDPYFVLGPDKPHPRLPFYLRDTNPWLLLAYREIFSITGVLCAIAFVFNIAELACFALGEVYWPNKNMVWLYVSTFGSFSAIIDDGLAGWWGKWWHQSFRLQLLSPAHYCLSKGYIRRHSKFGDAFALFVSFFLSGLLHAPGSVTSIPETKPWRSMAFFILQAVGIVIQREAIKPLLKKAFEKPPAYLSKAINLGWALVWMHPTAKLFCDDIASTGIWMYEPVPVSPLRWLGYGLPGDHWWRWDRHLLPSIYVGKRWWQSGIGL